MTGDKWIKWVWVSADERTKPRPPGVLIFNWLLAFLLLALLCFFFFSQLRYNWNWDTVGGYSNFFWRGWLNTLRISSLALVLSTVIGLLAALARRSGLLVLTAISRLYVELVRGTPLLVQISFAFYVVADAFHFQNRIFKIDLLLVCSHCRCSPALSSARSSGVELRALAAPSSNRLVPLDLQGCKPIATSSFRRLFA